ncbi:hypothetical protein QTP88_026062 [Uroleucon formosanum]
MITCSTKRTTTFNKFMNLTLNTSGIPNEQILLFISDISNCTLLNCTYFVQNKNNIKLNSQQNSYRTVKYRFVIYTTSRCNMETISTIVNYYDQTLKIYNLTVTQILDTSVPFIQIAYQFFRVPYSIY